MALMPADIKRRALLASGAILTVGAGTYAWLARMGYLDHPETPESPRTTISDRKARSRTQALGHDPFDPRALAVLAPLLDLLLPGLPEHELPSASQVGVLDYLIQAAQAPGLGLLRADILKLTRYLSLQSRKAHQKKFEALKQEAQVALLEQTQAKQGKIGRFSPARALHATLRLAMEGYLGHPHHGGNLQARAWKKLSIEMPTERHPMHKGHQP